MRRLLGLMQVLCVCVGVLGVAKVVMAAGDESKCSIKVRRVPPGGGGPGAGKNYLFGGCNTTIWCGTGHCTQGTDPNGFIYCHCDTPQIPAARVCKVGFKPDGGSIVVSTITYPTGSTTCVNYDCPYYDECPEPTWTPHSGPPPYETPGCPCTPGP